MKYKAYDGYREACKLAYGFLWLDMRPSQKSGAAREALLAALSSEERIAGVKAAQDALANAYPQQEAVVERALVAERGSLTNRKVPNV